MSNDSLKSVYDAVYTAGEQSFHTCDNWEESLLIHRMGEPWTGKRVLEIGCGRGRLSALIAMSGAKRVWAADYSEEAHRLAAETFCMPNLKFTKADWSMMRILSSLRDRPSRWEAIVMQGVLEHQDDPWDTLGGMMNALSPGGILITSSPNFLNPRGFIWQTLRILLGVPMSLTDLHYISVPDMLAWAEAHAYQIEYESCHHSWAGGDVLLSDFAKRLPNALRDAGLPVDRVPELLDWLKTTTPYYRPEPWSGANVVYRIQSPAPVRSH